MLVSNLQLSCSNAPFVAHAVLLVGTKCAAIYSKPKNQAPVSSPQQTPTNQQSNSSFTLLPRDILCLIIYAHSVYQITEADESLFQGTSASSQMTYSMKTETETSNESSDEETDENKEEANNNQSDDESQASGNNQEAPEEEEEIDDAYEDDYENPIPVSKFDSVYLHTVPNRHVASLTRCAVYSEHLAESNITVIYICQPDTVIEAPSAVSTTPESPNEKPPTNRELLMGAAQSLKQQRDFKTFTDFLKMKAFALTMQHYLHYCPGLIHFIFVDRIRDRVLAPRIVSLHTTRSFSESNGSVQSPTAESAQKIQLSVEFIKEKVWEMCHMLQEYQEKGFTEVALCAEGVQYWYKEWYEDEQGTEMRVMQPAHLKFVRGHYELYTMYLPFVSAQAVSTNNKWLVQNLLKTN